MPATLPTLRSRPPGRVSVAVLAPDEPAPRTQRLGRPPRPRRPASAARGLSSAIGSRASSPSSARSQSPQVVTATRPDASAWPAVQSEHRQRRGTPPRAGVPAPLTCSHQPTSSGTEWTTNSPAGDRRRDGDGCDHRHPVPPENAAVRTGTTVSGHDRGDARRPGRAPATRSSHQPGPGAVARRRGRGSRPPEETSCPVTVSVSTAPARGRAASATRPWACRLRTSDESDRQETAAAIAHRATDGWTRPDDPTAR